MNTTIPRKTRAELEQMKGGELVVRYMECVRRYERMPDAQWLRQRLDDTGLELHRRMMLGTLSEALCGLVKHVHDHAGTIRHCDCAES